MDKNMIDLLLKIGGISICIFIFACYLLKTFAKQNEDSDD